MSATFKRYWASSLDPAVPDADKEAVLKMCVVHSSKPGVDIDDLIQDALLVYLETRGNLALVRKAIYAAIYQRPTGRRAKLTSACIVEFAASPEDAFCDASVLEAFATLGTTEQIVVWFVVVVGSSQKELAKSLRLTQPQISRILRQSLATMRSSLE